jgi:hypothetical protein
VLFFKYYQGEQIKGDEMGGEFRKHELEGVRNSCISFGKPKEVVGCSNLA